MCATLIVGDQVLLPLASHVSGREGHCAFARMDHAFQDSSILYCSEPPGKHDGGPGRSISQKDLCSEQHESIKPPRTASTIHLRDGEGTNAHVSDLSLHTPTTAFGP